MMHTRFAGRISFLFCAALLHAAVVASGETYTWTGAADNTWNKADNWEGGKVFVSSLENDLVINKANAPIPNNTQMHNLTLNASVSLNGGPRIAVSGNIFCVGGGITFTFWGGVDLKGENVTFDLSGGSISLAGTNPYCSIEGEGMGLTLTKSGGSGTLSLNTTKGYPNFTGPLVIENGVVLALPNHSSKDIVNKLKTTDVTVQGAGSQLQLGDPTNITQEAEIKLKDEATLQVSSGAQIVIRSLVIDGKKCAPGVWGLPHVSGVTHATLRVLGGGSVLVTDEDGDYEGGDLWSGKTATWLRSAGTDSLTTAGNWEDDYLPKDYDDIVFGASCSGQKLSYANVHNLTINAPFTSATYWGSTINLTGGFYVGPEGSLTASRCNAGFNLVGEQVIFEVAEGGSFSRNGAEGEYFSVSGSGGLTVRGASGISWNQQTKFTFTGPLVVESGKLSFPNQTATVVTETVVVTGATSSVSLQQDNQLNTNTVLTLTEGGKMFVSSGRRQLVKEMWIDGQKCATGTWGTPASGATHPTLRVGGDGVIEVWGEGGDYEGGDVWTGDTRTWTGAVDKDWNKPGNWKEGIVPVSYDDVVIDADAVNQPESNVKSPSIHNLILHRNLSYGYGPTYKISGGLYCDGGSLTFSWNGSVELLSKETVFDLTDGSVSLAGTNQGGLITGTGGLVLTKKSGGTGSLSLGNGQRRLRFTGPLVVKNGVVLTLTSNEMFASTDLTVTGDGSLVKFKGAQLPAGATVSLSDGGMVALVGNFTNDIAHLILDGKDRVKHTYGGRASSAERKLSKYFVEKEGNAGNLGVFNVTEGGRIGLLLFVR